MAGEPWKTADKVREVLTTLYHDRPDGLSGNEDVGQMSAWYVLSSSDSTRSSRPEAATGSACRSSTVPRWRCRAAAFVVEAANNTPENRYIQRVTLNGAPYDKPYNRLPRRDGRRCLRFEMGPEPVCWYTVG